MHGVCDRYSTFHFQPLNGILICGGGGCGVTVPVVVIITVIVVAIFVPEPFRARSELQIAQLSSLWLTILMLAAEQVRLRERLGPGGAGVAGVLGGAHGQGVGMKPI